VLAILAATALAFAYIGYQHLVVAKVAIGAALPSGFANGLISMRPLLSLSYRVTKTDETIQQLTYKRRRKSDSKVTEAKNKED